MSANSRISEIKEIKEEPEEDYLEVDPPIPGQNYVCLSFVSPEDTIKKRSLFEARQFIQSVLDLVASGKETLEGAQKSLTMDAYLDYAVTNESANEALFNAQNNFKTSVRGVKVRGSFDTLKEAQRKAKVLQTRDPTFNVFVGAMGYWLPWDPNPDKVENQEFANQQLNEIVKKYKENKQSKDEIWENDLRQRIEKTKADGLAGAAAAAAEAAEATATATATATAATAATAAAAAEEDVPVKVIGGDSTTNSNSSRAIFEESEDLFLSRKQKDQLTSYVAASACSSSS